MEERFFTETGLDPSTPLYRFMSWEWVRDLLVDGKLVLVRPDSWQDPYELIDRPVQVRIRGGGQAKTQMLETSRFEVFSQSWTTKPMADTMLRAYSKLSPEHDDGETFDPLVHKAEAVQISTTVGKLTSALARAVRDVQGFEKQYIARVKYHPEAELFSRVAGLVANGPNSLNDPSTIATMLSLKRDSYHAECEIRPIVLFDNTAHDWPRLTLTIDAKDVIDSVSIDPRVQSHRVGGFRMHAHHNRRAFLAECGFESKIVDSHLYAASPMFDFTIDLDAPDCKFSDASRLSWHEFLQASQPKV